MPGARIAGSFRRDPASLRDVVEGDAATKHRVKVTERVPRGSRVLGCEHVDPEHPGGLRIMQLVPPTSIVASPAARARDTAARSFECGWVFLCDACWREAGSLGVDEEGDHRTAIRIASQDFTLGRDVAILGDAAG